MNGLLIGIGVLVFIALVVAGVNGTENALAQRELNKKLGEAMDSAKGQLGTFAQGDLGAEGIAVRMSGLSEFLHSLSTIRDSEHRSGLPSLALFVAGLLVVGGGVAVVLDRIEDRREVEACVDGVAAVGTGTATTTTAAPVEDEPAETERLPGETTPDEGGTTPDEGGTTPEEGGTAPDEGETTPDEGGTTPDEGGTTPDEDGDVSGDDNGAEPTDVPAESGRPNLGQFLSSCLEQVRR